MTEKESSVEKYLVKSVEKLGGLCLKFTSPGNAGVPDRVVIHGATVVFVELKRPKGGKLGVAQLRMHAKLRAAGASVFTLASKVEVDTFCWFIGPRKL